MNNNENKEREEYLFKVARRVLDWAEVEYDEEQLAGLVMLELFNYPINL